MALGNSPTPLEVQAAVKELETGKLDKTGGTMTGNLITNSPPVATLAVRNIYAGTSDMTAGSSALATGAIYLVYE